MSRSRRLRVLVYVPQVLPIYQPWVRQHVELLSPASAVVVGRSRAADSLDLSTVSNFCLADQLFGRLEGVALLFTGWSPRLERFIRAFAPDLIHAHFGPGATEVMYIARRLGTPLVVSYHGWDAKIPDRGRSPTLYERLHLRRRAHLFDQAALVLAVSHWMKREVIALGSAPEKTEVHYLGIDRELFDGRRKNDGGNRVAIVGRLVRFKGVHFALEALRILRYRVPGVSVEIMGAGPERGRLEASAIRENLPVTFLGEGSQTEARDLFARARVHCLPSTLTEDVQGEAFGLVAAEAQAMGVPVVGTRTGGISEAVADGKTGILVPGADPASLAEALQQLLTDRALHRRMSVAAQALVADKFDVRKNVVKLVNRYHDLL